MAKRFDEEIWLDAPSMVMVGRCVPFGLYYQVSSQGRVKRTAAGAATRKGRVKRLAECESDRRRKVTLSIRGQKYKVDVHALVARAFLGDPPSSRHRVMHLAGNRSDNRLSMLAWATESEIKQARDLKYAKDSDVMLAVMRRRAQTLQDRHRLIAGASAC